MSLVNSHSISLNSHWSMVNGVANQ